MKIYHLLCYILLVAFTACSTPKVNADILILNGTIYSGKDLVLTDASIAIKDDKIIYFGAIDTLKYTASRIIDASNLVICPGFIDPHTHADRDLIDSTASHNAPFLFQGVTTVVIGNDGDSFYPTSEYLQRFKANGIGTNIVPLVGHGTIRRQVIGKVDRKASAAELVRMKDLIKKEMDAGCFGMSTGLFYAPGSYANTEEVIELAKVVAKNEGIYDTHLRDESSYSIGLIPAIEEAVHIGEQSKIPVHISHIKCLGKNVWKQSDSIITIIESAQKNGLEITANQYPYEASATSLNGAVVPRWAESGGIDSLFIRYSNPTLKSKILVDTEKNIELRGGADKLLIVRTPFSAYYNRYLSEIAEELKIPAEEAVYNILKKGATGVVSFNMDSYDIINFMEQKWVITGSDGNTGHPRKYGTFPRKYHTYVLQKKVLSLKSFITNSTSKTAEFFRIKQRGEIKEGNYADIIVFDPSTFRDKSSYENPFQLAQGIKYSIINGKLTIDRGKFTGQLHGEVLKK